MKKLMSVAIALAISTAPITSLAADNIRIFLNGNYLAMPVEPQIINDRTMVPLRAIFEGLGATVNWEQDTQTIRSQKNGIFVMMQIGNPIMTVNDEPIVLDAVPVISNGSTLVPVRAIAESYNMRVNWDADERIVSISNMTPLVPGKYVFDYDTYDITNHENAYVTVGKTKYHISVPDNMSIERTHYYMNHELYSDTIWGSTDSISLEFNTAFSSTIQ